MTTADTSEPTTSGPAADPGQAAPAGDPGRPLTVTEAALATVLDVRAGEDDPAGTALRVEITGAN
ncbi:MAG: hypothetical protein AAGA65_13205, partial [Actinomycetota bacterium]